MQKTESKKHVDLIAELAQVMKRDGYTITAIDIEGHKKPDVIENSGTIGDGENKIPDICSTHTSSGRIARGEAKTGEGDIGTQHSITQYCLCSNRSKNGLPSKLYVIVPGNKRQELNDVITNNVPRQHWDNIVLVSSEIYSQ
ncbi:hypothetical protein A3G63_00200 [Candidatus Kaiserbacteria bacterium RIFCSPLOWO2_12_FULL_52_8]|uniref:Restriction endonuclease type IV Mrr domain-containing protein n=1 Tax=Candidatus Kaiserbacteria bacterium RIFCSPHIGHO2_01_FULL_53_31 TaxID=1798481 RepID=A0A1F6CGL5_9BACT|nr:MAG: hypothetical protein A2678_03200 [Candidatus Kaiserbacteria bacterium RIFCSPHIGHO2_01_FULL_53_31]OGG94440.1 MAG: hypothetical protein A3G63_00200 [Candidatus Kaiserbacteria bacterium RIFCSPLOWO2_12_FULL_52_8]